MLMVVEEKVNVFYCLEWGVHIVHAGNALGGSHALLEEGFARPKLKSKGCYAISCACLSHGQ